MNTKYDPIETAKRHLRDCMESPDYPVHNCYVTCNDVAYLLAEVERLHLELERHQVTGDYEMGQHHANAALEAEVERLRAEVEQVELINFRRVEENTRLRKALTMIRNAVDITRDQVTEGWIIGVADDALKLG